MRVVDHILFSLFSLNVYSLKVLSKFLQPKKREECFDRPYINDYINLTKEYIRGDVLEFAGGDVIYAQKYGTPCNVYLMAGIAHKNVYPNADFYTDLDDIATLPDKKFDCIVATQVIMYMKNVEVALQNLKTMLKPGGALIITVPGPLFHHSKGSHHMFSFTEESLEYLCDKVFHNYEKFKYYGDISTAERMLFWTKAYPKMKEKQDYLYTLVMGITVRKED